MQIDVRADTKKLTKWLNQAERKQVPFATSRALNATAFNVRSKLQKELPNYLDRPTGGIIKSVQVQTSSKRNLVATVGFVGDGFRKSQWRNSPASIMKKQIEGGVRYPNKKAIAVPVQLKTNTYGNIPRNKLTNLLANKKKYFSGVPKGRSNAGLYERKKNGLKMLVSWESKTNYNGGRYPFNYIAKSAVQKNYKKNFDKELTKALKSSK